MNVELAVLADYATTTADGKLIIAGVFDMISVASFPAQHPAMYLALRIHGDGADIGAHALELRLVDPDARGVVPAVTSRFEVPDPGELSAIANSQFVINMANIAFEKPGPYAFDILIDERYELSVSFEVRQLAPASHE
ncbi:MAG: hypothetical protein NTW58_02395 [Actinobacteria bacterium]|nr:hypothetical protein [Actinomycetota bacterium]